MASPANGFYASSPAVVLPPNQTNYFASAHYTDTADLGSAPATFVPTFASGTSSLATTPGALAGRKRSRGDVHAPEDDEEGLGDGSVDTAIAEMPVNPLGNQVHSNSSDAFQSATWLDQTNQAPEIHLEHPTRPMASSRKSQRKGTITGTDDLAQLLLPSDMREATGEPLIDEATRVLGISWTRMDASEAIQIRSAAYSKLIMKHYPALKDVTIWFENSSIPCYLARALNAYSDLWEYFIFSHDLKEARLVTTDPTQLVPRLKMLPALELAAPGGTMYAVPDPNTSALITTQSLMAEDDRLIHGGGTCELQVHAANEMDVD